MLVQAWETNSLKSEATLQYQYSSLEWGKKRDRERKMERERETREKTEA